MLCAISSRWYFYLYATILELVLLQYFFTIFVLFSARQSFLVSTRAPHPSQDLRGQFSSFFPNIMNINTEIFKVVTTLVISYSLDVDDVSMQGGESPASGPQQCSCYVRTIKLEN